MKFKAYVLSPSTDNHGGYVVLRVPPFAKTMDEASDFTRSTVNKLRKSGINVETWFVEKDLD